ncbi:MAG: hypothetical protein RIA63_14160, partial [Cyclobacteriaceae bacterium]
VLVIGAALFFIFRPVDQTENPEDLLASVSTEELADYLAESDFTTDDLLENIDLNEVDINALNEDIYPDFDSDILEEYADQMQFEL